MADWATSSSSVRWNKDEVTWLQQQEVWNMLWGEPFNSKSAKKKKKNTVLEWIHLVFLHRSSLASASGPWRMQLCRSWLSSVSSWWPSSELLWVSKERTFRPISPQLTTDHASFNLPHYDYMSQSGGHFGFRSNATHCQF